jgi:hypothetical protein
LPVLKHQQIDLKPGWHCTEVWLGSLMRHPGLLVRWLATLDQQNTCCQTVALLSRVSNEHQVQSELKCYHAAGLNIPWPIFQVALLVREWTMCRLGGFSLTQMEFPYMSACPMRHTLSQEWLVHSSTVICRCLTRQ